MLLKLKRILLLRQTRQFRQVLTLQQIGLFVPTFSGHVTNQTVDRVGLTARPRPLRTAFVLLQVATQMSSFLFPIPLAAVTRASAFRSVAVVVRQPSLGDGSKASAFRPEEGTETLSSATLTRWHLAVTMWAPHSALMAPATPLWKRHRPVVTLARPIQRSIMAATNEKPSTITVLVKTLPRSKTISCLTDQSRLHSPSMKIF